MTKEELKSQFKNLGIKPEMKLLVHVSLSKVGHLDNGAKDLIEALKETVTENGIIAMPAYNCYNDYKPNLSIVNEVFKNQPDVICTNQIIASFAVWGNNKEKIAVNVPYTEEGLSFENGENSTIAKLYQNNGWSLLIGTDYSTCTMMHLAENRAKWPGKFIYTEEVTTPIRTKVTYHDLAYQEEDFNEIGLAFEAKYHDNKNAIRYEKIGNADSRLINQRVLVDFAETWMNTNRK